MNDLEKAVKAMTKKSKNIWGNGDSVEGFIKVIIDICNHYAEKLGYDPLEVFEALEKKRTYSFPNYYQLANFPKLDGITIFKDQKEMLEKMQPLLGFRCPACNGISKSPYRCESGDLLSDKKICGWKSYGLFGALGKGFQFTISENWIEKPMVDTCFMPIAMETINDKSKKD